MDGGNSHSGKKSEEPAKDKCNQPQIGSWSTATAKQPRDGFSLGGARPAGDEKPGGGIGGGLGGGMNFSKKAPMFTRSSKPKQGSSPEQASLTAKHDDYDFSKMRMAAVSVRKPREEGEEGWSRTEDSEEKKHEMHERPREKRVPQPFNLNAPVVKAADPDEDEDGFTVV